MEPTTFLYNSAITACGMNGRSDEALLLFDSMYKSGVPTTSVTYGAVIDACGRGGKHNKVLYLLNLMESRGQKPTPICYKIAFRGLLVAKDWDGAMEVFSRVRMFFNLRNSCCCTVTSPEHCHLLGQFKDFERS